MFCLVNNLPNVINVVDFGRNCITGAVNIVK